MRRPFSPTRWKRDASVSAEPLAFHAACARLEWPAHGSSAELPGFTSTRRVRVEKRGLPEPLAGSIQDIEAGGSERVPGTVRVPSQDAVVAGRVPATEGGGGLDHTRV
ncbi:hypothetical protein EYF80_007882 [Liparis tanakae]|uniref:Uncharacterized protein n=1 Tax=Liparis tanakae TaxID=230148 RepID=A0A4Z2IWW5_9TELE|nr:hypothetical protein EYF80_007882 [Liparis tanakae]